MRNLDQLAAQTAQKIVNESGNPKELDTLATKTLGVLQENGVYACVLFLDSRTSTKDNQMAKQICSALEEATRQVVSNSGSSSNLREWIASELANNLDTLLLVKALWEQILIYVRYGAKAKDAGQRKES